MLPLLSWATYLFVVALGGADSLAVDTNVNALPTSNVLSSMLSGTSNVCTDIKTCRTLGQIVVSCLATILACAWLAVHRNIPAPEVKRPRHGTFFVRSAKWAWHTILNQREPAIVFVVALLAPEWILAWAVRQALCARALCKKLEVARRQAMGKRFGRDEGQCEECGERRCRCYLDTAAQRVGKGDEGAWIGPHIDHHHLAHI
ncbi:hypothetical protein FIBSPDRAFT_865211 [Athelia psychrophila]|uniref:Uncharacterized protein n=1 Tax=Athelia psychrophila TaxID=1759441 RepID=A0A166FWB5_9AGAM|nr:hypothetical protein FIBSPDRAFT_865211 [Fibularhizoctonia sp. CBS 109695]